MNRAVWFVLAATMLVGTSINAESLAKKKARAEDKVAFELALQNEVKRREEMGRKFEKEREKYQAYIRELIARMKTAEITVPEWDEDE